MGLINANISLLSHIMKYWMHASWKISRGLGKEPVKWFSVSQTLTTLPWIYIFPQSLTSMHAFHLQLHFLLYAACTAVDRKDHLPALTYRAQSQNSPWESEGVVAEQLLINPWSLGLYHAHYRWNCWKLSCQTNASIKKHVQSEIFQKHVT